MTAEVRIPAGEIPGVEGMGPGGSISPGGSVCATVTKSVSRTLLWPRLAAPWAHGEVIACAPDGWRFVVASAEEVIGLGDVSTPSEKHNFRARLPEIQDSLAQALGLHGGLVTIGGRVRARAAQTVVAAVAGGTRHVRRTYSVALSSGGSGPPPRRRATDFTRPSAATRVAPTVASSVSRDA